MTGNVQKREKQKCLKAHCLNQSYRVSCFSMKLTYLLSMKIFLTIFEYFGKLIIGIQLINISRVCKNNFLTKKYDLLRQKRRV